MFWAKRALAERWRATMLCQGLPLRVEMALLRVRSNPRRGHSKTAPLPDSALARWCQMRGMRPHGFDRMEVSRSPRRGDGRIQRRFVKRALKHRAHKCSYRWWSSPMHKSSGSSPDTVSRLCYWLRDFDGATESSTSPPQSIRAMYCLAFASKFKDHAPLSPL